MSIAMSARARNHVDDVEWSRKDGTAARWLSLRIVEA